MMHLMNRVNLYWNYFKTLMYYKYIFKNVGRGSILYPFMRIVGSERISIGCNTVIEKEATLYSIGRFSKTIYNGEISIGNNVYINHHFNATAANSIIIEDDVLIAYNVSLFDFNHGYENINENINCTELEVKGPIVIGEKSWLGMNVAIIGKVKVGKHCIIGANSVVTRDVPDYCIVVGNPARIVKRFNQSKNKWEKVESE